MELTSSQQKTVDKLFFAFIKKEENKSCALKAPTGSGKTFMCSELISRIFSYNNSRNKKTMIIIATISNAELPMQFALKLSDYKIYHEYQNYEIEYITSPSSAKTTKVEDIKEFTLSNNKAYVFGVSSFGKNTLFYQNRTLNTFLQQIKNQNYQLIYIRDEAHIGKKEKITKEDLKSFDSIVKKASCFILEMTATPKTPENLIQMTAKDLELDNQYLLKTEMIKTKLNGEISSEEIIEDAINTFKKTKKEYQSLKKIINPAMLIQIINQPTIKVDKLGYTKFNEALQLLENKLQKAGLIYLKYTNNTPVVIGSNLPTTLKYASKIDSQIDAIIFKVGPATGWDIPRANMLLQLRNVSSEQLNIQTLGRIMRNPYPNLEKNHITDKFYVWSNYQKPTRELVSYRLKDKFKNLTLPSGFIDMQDKTVTKDKKTYINEVIDFITKNKTFSNRLQDINDDTDKNIIWKSLNYGDAVDSDRILNHIELKIHNIKKHRKYEQWLHISKFDNTLKKISKKYNINFEISQYTLFTFVNKLNEIKNITNDWPSRQEPYKIKQKNNLLQSYKIWKDKENPKRVNFSTLKNYGYQQISEKETEIQYLDSNPEKIFFDKFMDALSKEQKNNIMFFSKMPTLGSQISWEYYSDELGPKTKTYADFVIKYGKKYIFVEVKGFDKYDYNQLKTKKILEAYQKYQIASTNHNIDFAIFQYRPGYQKNEEISNLQAEINGKWETKVRFRDFVDEKLK